MKGPAPHDAVGARGRSGRVGDGRGANVCLVEIVDPLVQVARHVVELPLVRRLAPHLVHLLRGVALVPGDLVGVGVGDAALDGAVVQGRGGAGPVGALPLGLGGQAVPLAQIDLGRGSAVVGRALERRFGSGAGVAGAKLGVLGELPVATAAWDQDTPTAPTSTQWHLSPAVRPATVSREVAAAHTW